MPAGRRAEPVPEEERGAAAVALVDGQARARELELVPPQMRRAPTYVDAYQPVSGEIFTTSPVCGAWIIWLPPM